MYAVQSRHICVADLRRQTNGMRDYASRYSTTQQELTPSADLAHDVPIRHYGRKHRHHRGPVHYGTSADCHGDRALEGLRKLP